MPGMQNPPSVRWNMIANLSGQGWRAFMSLLFVPFYLRILGVEAYGLIGLYTSLQLAMALLDSGLKPTLGREMARFSAGTTKPRDILVLLHSVETALTIVALGAATMLALIAPWLANHWVHPQAMPLKDVAQAFTIMGAVAAAQLIESTYDSCLAGLQRQVLQNVIVSIVASLRGFGSLLVLWYDPSISAFFLWQGLVTLVSLTLLRSAVYRILPAPTQRPRFSFQALSTVRNYASGMLGIAVVALLLTQSDKVLLARFLPLSDVGRYTLAGALATSIAMLSGPIGNAFFPRLTQLLEEGVHQHVAASFHLCTKLMVIIVGAAAAMLIIFGDRLMNLWIFNPQLSAETAPILAILALAALFNALAAPTYIIQLAHGSTSLTLRISLVMLVIFPPSLYFAITYYGALGAATSAMGLGLVYATVGATLILRKFIPNETYKYWIYDVGFFLVVVFGTTFLMSAILPNGKNFLSELTILGLSGFVTIFTCAGVDKQLRTALIKIAESVFVAWRKTHHT